MITTNVTNVTKVIKTANELALSLEKECQDLLEIIPDSNSEEMNAITHICLTVPSLNKTYQEIIKMQADIINQALVGIRINDKTFRDELYQYLR